MRTQSLQRIKTWRKENATSDEKSYFAALIPMIRIASSCFGDDGLAERQDCLFVNGFLPLRTGFPEAQLQGVTTPKPDLVFGLKAPRHPKLNAPILKPETETLIGVAPGIKHPFFSIDYKSAQKSIEAAENQAMRAGATMVNARRLLNREAAKGKVETLLQSNSIVKQKEQ